MKRTHELVGGTHVPYAYINDDYSVDCEVCGEHFPTLPRKAWKDWETPATGYEAHFVEAASRD